MLLLLFTLFFVCCHRPFMICYRSGRPRTRLGRSAATRSTCRPWVSSLAWSRPLQPCRLKSRAEKGIVVRGYVVANFISFRVEHFRSFPRTLSPADLPFTEGHCFASARSMLQINMFQFVFAHIVTRYATQSPEEVCVGISTRRPTLFPR